MHENTIIMHMYFFSHILTIVNYFRTSLIVSFSLPLFLFTLVVSMAPKHKSTPSWNPLHFGASSPSSDPTPSYIWFRDEDARKAFSENFSRRGIHSERQVILADGSHYVMSWSLVLLCLSRSFTLTCIGLIVQYLFSSLAFEVRAFLSHCNLLRMCFGSLG